MRERRVRALAGTVTRLLLAEAGRFAETRGEPQERAEDRAKALRSAFEGLGPFYIKLGQMLSTRPDFVSETTMRELATLHDRVPASPFTVFEPVLADELGPGWRQRFREIDVEHPLGSASLAQVYRVVLADGREGALKVQRPGIRPLIHADMALLRRSAAVVARAKPRFNAVVDLHAMLNLIFEAMEGELDFTVEAANMALARRDVAGFAHLTVPEVLLGTRRVLVQELVPGRSIADPGRPEVSEEDRLAIAHDLLAFMYHSYFVGRTFHADPHPGNVFVRPDGRAALIDWGMVGRLDRPMSLRLALMLANVAQNDGEGAARAWIEMGRATPWSDVDGFSTDVAALVPKAAVASLEELNFGLTLTTVLRHSTRRGIRTGPVVPLLGKSFANLEGSVRELAPEISAAEVFRVELTDTLVDLVCEMLSDGYLARGALELMLTSDGSHRQARGIVRDLASRQLHLPADPTETPTGTMRSSRQQQLVLGVAALATAIWLRRSGKD